MKSARSLLVGAAMFAVLVGGAAFAFSSVGFIGGPSPQTMKIDFPSADGLVAGSDVLEAGSKIGTIQSIEPTQGNSALVTISVDASHWPLHKGLSADIRPKSLLGEKYVDLHDGPSSAAAYDTSMTLQANQNADPVELDQFLNSLDPSTRTAVRVLLDDLGAGVAGRGNDLNAAIAAGKNNLANLAVTGQTLNDRDPDLDKILVGLDGLLSKLTTNDQLNQLSQLITNGQNVLNDIEQVQQPFSRQFTDANAALADLNVAFDGAIPSLRSTLNIGQTLVSNLSTETSLLGELACGSYANPRFSGGPQGPPAPGQSCPNGITSTRDLSPGQSCTSGDISTAIPQLSASTPANTLPGLSKCSPLWYLIKGLIQGPTVSGGALEMGNPNSVDPGSDPIFRICLSNPNGASSDSCENNTSNSTFAGSSSSSTGAAFAAWLGS
jgi:virulence factor Mce-like protein